MFAMWRHLSNNVVLVPQVLTLCAPRRPHFLQMAACFHAPLAGHRSTLRSSVFAFWHRASVYVRLSAFCLRIYATTKVRPVCVYVFENNACVRK